MFFVDLLGGLAGTAIDHEGKLGDRFAQFALLFKDFAERHHHIVIGHGIGGIETVKEVLGQGSIEFTVPKGSTVRKTLLSMSKKWGEKLSSLIFNPDGSLLPYIRVMVNGQDLEFLENKIETALQEGDEILILPPVAGG